MSKKTEELVGELSKLSVLEMAELKKTLEETWGVTAAAPAAVVAAAPAAGEGKEAAEEEATDFQVILEGFSPAKKIAVIKIVRQVSGLGLKEAKELVESAPKVLKESSPKAEAEDIKKQLEGAEAKVTLKGI